jgi:uncharacterized protein
MSVPHSPRAGGPAIATLGRAIVRAMPPFLTALSLLGTAAMLWVGGGLVLHRLEEYGWGAPAQAIHDLAHHAGEVLAAVGPAVAWLVSAAAAGLFGLVLGAVVVPVAARFMPAH